MVQRGHEGPRRRAAWAATTCAGFGLFAGSTHAGMVQLLPAASSTFVTITYATVGTGAAAEGKLTATGITTKVSRSTGDSSTMGSPNSFSLTAYFTQGGTLEGTHAGTDLDVTGAGGELFFHSNVLYAVDAAFTPYASKPGCFTSIFEFLWQKPAGAASGTLASTSLLPFIGTRLQSDSAFKSAVGATPSLAFTPGALANNTVLFTSSGGSANTFMTPMPAALPAGAALVGLLVSVRTFTRRRERREAIVA